MFQPWSCTAKTIRSFPSRTRRKNQPGLSRVPVKSTIQARHMALRPRIRIESTQICWSFYGASRKLPQQLDLQTVTYPEARSNLLLANLALVEALSEKAASNARDSAGKSAYLGCNRCVLRTG